MTSWKDDTQLKESMELYSTQGLKRVEMLDFLKQEFCEYNWSLRTLDRRLRAFNIYRTDKTVTEQSLMDAVSKEMNGPGKLLGYRAMTNKIRQIHNLKVPRRLVYAAMYDLDYEGLKARSLENKNRQRVRGKFYSAGPNWVYSLDGHAKLMGFQKNTFPLAIYGCIDTASRKIMFLRIGTGNSDPRRIGMWYLEHIMESGYISSKIRIDKGTETGTMATMHAFLRSFSNDCDELDTVIYGKSTSNQV